VGVGKASKKAEETQILADLTEPSCLPNPGPTWTNVQEKLGLIMVSEYCILGYLCYTAQLVSLTHTPHQVFCSWGSQSLRTSSKWNSSRPSTLPALVCDQSSAASNIPSHPPPHTLFLSSWVPCCLLSIAQPSLPGSYWTH
jgi:hypothetical protein